MSDFLNNDLGDTTTTSQVTDPEEIKLLQQFLLNMGYQVTVDGVMGPKTLEALQAWEKAAGLAITGVYPPEMVGRVRNDYLAQVAGGMPQYDGGSSEITPQPVAADPTAGGGGAGGATTPGSAPPIDSSRLPKNASEADAIKWVQENLPSMAWMLEIPDVKAVLFEGARNGWDSLRINSEIQGTGWWKATAPAARNWLALLKTDPAAARAQLDQAVVRLRLQRQQLGLSIGETRIKELAEQSLRLGWGTDELKGALVSEARWSNNRGVNVGGSGQIQATMADVNQVANEWMLPISSATAFNWSKRILEGSATVETMEQHFRTEAKKAFGYNPDLVRAIDSGMSVGDYLSPYREMAARELEMNPTDIDFTNPRWSRAFSSMAKDGTKGSMSFSEWTEYLRTQPEWKKTKGAQEQATSVAMRFRQMFRGY